MKLPEFSVKNSLLVNLLSVFIITVGLVSLFQLRREAFPTVDFDVVTVTTVFPGAPAEDVEKLVTTPIEKELKGISGIKEMTSKSEEGISLIGLEIDLKARDKDKIINDIERAVDRVKNLPAEIKEDPTVLELTADEFPVLNISISGDISEQEQRRYAENLEDLLLEVTGVARVQRIGWRDREFWVEVSPDKLSEYHVSIAEIMEALKSRNITAPAGQLITPKTEFNVRVTDEFTTPQEVEEVVIRANDAGNWLKVRDVARVIDTFEDEIHISKINGHRAISMAVVKNKTGDIIQIVSNLQKTLAQFKKGLPEGLEITVTNDISYYVKRRLKVLQTNGAIGLFMVLLVLFLFLDPVPALMTALGLPIALFSTFGIMFFFGISVNLVSMLGLIIVLGMLVDDGIIVSENVYRYIESGMPPRQAAIKGTGEVMAPVTVTILTTWAAFSPFLFMQDLIGRFIRAVPIVVMVALGASLLEAFIILPSHLSDFVKARKSDLDKKNQRREKPWFRRLLSAYTRILDGALNHRYKLFVGLVLTFFAAIFVAVFFMKIIMWGGEGIEYFFVRAEAKKSTPLEEMERLIKPVERLIATLPVQELDSYHTYLGGLETERHFDPNAKNGSHLGQIKVSLTPAQKRKRTPQEITDSLRPELDKIKGFEKLYFYLEKEGPPVGMPVEVGIKGERFEVMQDIADKFSAALKQMRGVSDVSSSFEFGKKQLKVVVDEEKAQRYYLTVGQIAASVRNVFDGGMATAIKPTKAEKEINVVVRFDQIERNDLKAFEKILIPNSLGNLIPLKAVARIEEAEGLYKIDHMDGKRVIMVTSQLDEKKATSLRINRALQKQFKDIGKEYPGYSTKYSGEFEEQQETMKGLLRAFAIAFFLIFIILATMFNSLVQPFIVMLAIPFGMVGVIFAFLLHGRPLSFFAFMGLVGLAGIVVNDSIVLVDFINKLRKEGKGRRESLIEAGQIRLRPVLMTSITTIAGLLSVAYGIGGGDPFLKPMALAIIWGLFFSTGLTLIVIPCIYSIIDDLALKLVGHGTVKKNNHSLE